MTGKKQRSNTFNSGADHMGWLERVCIVFPQTARRFVGMYVPLLCPALIIFKTIENLIHSNVQTVPMNEKPDQ